MNQEMTKAEYVIMKSAITKMVNSDKTLRNTEIEDDLTSECLFQFYRKVDRIRATAFPFSYLRRMCINICHNYLEQQGIRRKRECSLSTFPLIEDSWNLQHSYSDQKDPSVPKGILQNLSYLEDVTTSLQIEELLEKLDPKDIELIGYRFQEYSYEEIAEKLGVPINTAKVQVHRARERAQRLEAVKQLLEK